MTRRSKPRVILLYATLTFSAWAETPEAPQTGDQKVPSAEPGEHSAAPESAGYAQSADKAPPPIIELLTGEAKRDYEMGRLFYDQHDYTNALLKFQAAFEASQDPRLLWNSAACEVKRFHYARASALMKRYLESGSPLITAEAALQARAFLEAAQKLTVRLVVVSNPTDAEVHLDGEFVGATPLANLSVDPGRHELLVKKRGFDDYTETLTLARSADRSLSVALTPVTREGRLLVRAGPGDRIQLDDAHVGTGSYDGVVPSGRHTVRVTATGARPFESTLVIRDKRTHSVQVSLEKLPLGVEVPTWVWIGGGATLAVGAGALGYWLLRPDDAQSPSGSIGGASLPLR